MATCLLLEQTTKRVNGILMVSCAAAGSAAHPSCIEISDPKLLAVIRTYAWKCMECKVRPAYRLPSVHQVLQHALFMSHRGSLLTSFAVLSRALANHCLLLFGFVAIIG
jgi:hypothetical protein